MTSTPRPTATGGIVKAHREWRISGDTAWLRGMWPAIKLSLNYCIDLGPGGRGLLVEPHHNTYDIEFWGRWHVHLVLSRRCRRR